MTSQENRKNPRRKIRIPLLCWEPTDGEKQGEGLQVPSKDISVTGVAFYSKKIYAIGTRLQMDIFVPGKDSPIAAKVKVFRVETGFNKDEFIIGASYEEIAPEDSALIGESMSKMNLYLLLESTIQGKATDLHLTVGRPPMVRRDGKILPMAAETIEHGQVEAMIYPLLSPQQVEFFEEHKELDFAFSPTLKSRFRVNMHRQKGYVEAVLRNIPTEVKTFAELGLPTAAMETIAHKTSGLFLICGTTGSGKTTTMSSIVDYINKSRNNVVVTIEDPIEYMIMSQQGIIKQRELGTDTDSYAEALKRVLRQDPDVICVGEILEAEALSAAMKAAETGHFVVSTIHAPDSISAIERAVGLFDPENFANVRQQLSSCLIGIISQSLVPCTQGGRVLASELLMNNSAVANLIREGRYSQLNNVLQTGKTQGMYTLKASLQSLYADRLITEEDMINFDNTNQYM